MPTIDVNLSGDNAWPDLAEKRDDIVHLPDAVWQVAALEAGMTSGKVSLALRLDLPPAVGAGGARVIVTETSLAAWITATCMLRARFPEAFAGTPLAEG